MSCGAIGSPRLLQLSGVGPADALKRAGVPVVHDLPGVGANLQDHLDLYAICECTGDHTYDRVARPDRTIWAGLQYLLFKTGPVTSTLFETGGFWYADKAARSPDIQFHLGLGSGIEAGVAQMRNPGVTLNSAFFRPRSRGTVRLAERRSDRRAVDRSQLLGRPVRSRMRAQRPAARARDHAPAGAEAVRARRAPARAGIETDEALTQYAYRSCKTDHHPAGTCAMGRGADAVVTPGPSGSRSRGTEGRRRLRHAVRAFVQHQRADGHGRGKGVRYYSRAPCLARSGEYLKCKIDAASISRSGTLRPPRRRRGREVFARPRVPKNAMRQSCAIVTAGWLRSGPTSCVLYKFESLDWHKSEPGTFLMWPRQLRLSDAADPLRARRAQFPLRRRPKPVRAVHQRVPGHEPPLEPDGCRTCFDRSRFARHRASDPDRRRDRCDARQARHHRSGDGGDDRSRHHHFRRSDLLADGARLQHPGACRRRLRSGGLGVDPRSCRKARACAAARPELGFRPRRQHLHRDCRRRGRVRILAARRLSHGSRFCRFDVSSRARHSGGSDQPRPG